MAVAILRGREKVPARGKQREAVKQLGGIARQLDVLRRQIAHHLEQAVDEPASLGMEGHVWRECQKKTQRDLAAVLRAGYSRPAFELPTGGGKSHVLGSLARSFLEAAHDGGLDISTQVKIVTLTSRTNLVRQLAVFEESDSEAEDAEDEGSVLKIGDLRQWVAALLNDEQVQVLTADSNESEIRKDAVLTVQTYQGLTEKRIRNLVSPNRQSLFILDESHNVTERVRRLLLKYVSGGFIIGGSATPFGPRRNPFLLFEEVEDGPAMSRKHPWEQKLASHQSLVELIGRKELKPPRLIRADTEISLAGVRSYGGVLNEQEVTGVLSRNVPLLKSLLHRLYTEDHPVLRATGRPQLRDRVAIAFVNSVDIAEALAEYVTQELHVPGTVLSGRDTSSEFDCKQEAMRARKIRFAATVRKGTEGLDVQAANAALLLQPHGPNSEWLRRQELGRVLRLNQEDPNDDALIIDAVYRDHPGSVSTLALFGEHQYLDGGLIAADLMRDAERVVLQKLQQGISLAEAIQSLEEPLLSAAQELFAPQLGMNSDGPGDGPGGGGGPTSGIVRRTYNLQNIQLVEEADAAKILQLQDRELLLRRARGVLAAMEIASRQSLLAFGATKFRETYFGEFGGCNKFYATVVGRLVSKFNTTSLEEFADALGWTADSPDDAKATARASLAQHGVSSRKELLAMGKTLFLSTSFGGEKGRAFFSRYVRQLPFDEAFHLAHLMELADALGWQDETPETKLERVKASLALHGISSRDELLARGVMKFKELHFEGFGGFTRLFSAAVRKLGRQESFTKAHLLEFADAMGWIDESQVNNSDALLGRARTSLAAHGVVSWATLMDFGSTRFKEADFEGFGKGKSLFQAIVRPMGGRRDVPGIAHLEELATVLGWKQETRETLLRRTLAALRDHGIVSRADLLKLSPRQFVDMDYVGFGKGRALFTVVVRQLESTQHLLRTHLLELADILPWSE